MSTKNISCGVKAAGARADNLTTFMCRLSWNMGASASSNLQSLSRPFNGKALVVYLTTMSIDQVIRRWKVRHLTKNELERCVRLRPCPNLWYYADIRLESLTGTTEYLNEVAHCPSPNRTGDLQKSGRSLYCFLIYLKQIPHRKCLIRYKDTHLITLKKKSVLILPLQNFREQ
jgi:hypothetical protein